ncbi:MAG: GYD domain-containing protein [Gammaproteobacteria bacterium]|nr:GYD domain-containing protein [Gammaproteobacteria bacterium]MYJ73731.1 GYD domain-containing protein [Gammaproteobacteria bacterium]
MAKYMLRANYTQQGLAGLLKEGGSGRRKALTQTVEGVGGSVEAMYYAFGDCDLYLIVDLPDETAAAALSMAIGSAGALDLKITVLITPESIDEAVAKSVPYRAPGA